MSESAYHPMPAQRIVSGVPGLDTILCGGFLKGGIYLLMGSPGAGKTILGNQLSFAHVATGGRVIYATLLAETHARMLTHIRSMRFFDPTPIADTLYYVSAYATLEQEGLKGLITLLRKEIRNRRATLLIIDGLITATEVAPSSLETKHFLHDLHVYTEAIGCTTFLLTQYDDEHQNRPEFMMADGLITLNDRLSDVRSVREIEVRKFRGSNSIRGRHLFEITEEGITIHPRTEALFTHTNNLQFPLLSDRRLQFGVSRLDEMLGGGVPKGSTTVLLGAPGSGKTLLGLHFLYVGARQQEPGLLLSFNESAAQLEQKAQRFGLEVHPLIEQNMLEFLWQSPLEDIVDIFAERLLAAIKKKNVQRLFIDGLIGFQQAVVSAERLGLFMSALILMLRLEGVTTLCTSEIPELIRPVDQLPLDPITVLADNIIYLRSIELRSQLYRLLSIMKMRDSGYDSSIREFRITTQGVEVANTFQSAEDILTGDTPPTPTPQSSFEDEPHSTREQQL